ncbi:MAG TPA: DUF790 family protein [Labilithrix sp.]
MLPLRLLDVTIEDGRIRPRWLGPRDEGWLGEALGAVDALAGQPAGGADVALRRSIYAIATRWKIEPRTVAVACALERRRWPTRVDAPAAPERVRDVTFELAAAHPRAFAIAEAASVLGIAPEDVERSLFADRAAFRVLVRPDESVTPRAATSAQNLALALGLLERATSIVARVRGDPRSLALRAKREGLLATFEEEGEATRVTVCGPLALFRATTRYGAALARFVPHVVASPSWSLVAEIVLAAGTARLELDGSAPIVATPPPSAEARGPCERLVRDLAKRHTKWRAEPASGAVPTRAGTLYPDLALVSDDGRALLEILTWATPEHVARVRAAAPRDVIVCVDRRGVRGAIAVADALVVFDRVIDADALLAAAERAIARPPPEGASA